MSFAAMVGVRGLRRSARPYVAFAIPLVLVLLFFLIVSIRTHQPATPWFEVFGVFAALYAGWAYFQVRYRVLWSAEGILQKASGLPDIAIRMEEIGWVHLESGISSGGRRGRPFRRIAIYSGEPGERRRCIDVSLKHFESDDIRYLMRAIHARRPDLQLPDRWV